MQNLLKTEDYSWALFMGHLVLEKLLKAVYFKKTGEHSIFTHDLLRLAQKAKLEVPNEFKEWLDVITTFNINVRYESYKQEFIKPARKNSRKTGLIKSKKQENG